MDKGKASIHKISLILTSYLKHLFILEIILNKYANQIFSLLYSILLAAVTIVYNARGNICRASETTHLVRAATTI